MSQLINGVVVILTAIIGVALLSVLVSKQSNTAGVLAAGQAAFSGALGTAMNTTGSGGNSAITFPGYSSTGGMA